MTNSRRIIPFLRRAAFKYILTVTITLAFFVSVGYTLSADTINCVLAVSTAFMAGLYCTNGALKIADSQRRDAEQNRGQVLYLMLSKPATRAKIVSLLGRFAFTCVGVGIVPIFLIFYILKDTTAANPTALIAWTILTTLLSTATSTAILKLHNSGNRTTRSSSLLISVCAQLIAATFISTRVGCLLPGDLGTHFQIYVTFCTMMVVCFAQISRSTMRKPKVEVISSNTIKTDGSLPSADY